MGNEIYEKLKNDVAEITWEHLKPHLVHDAIIIVSQELNLIDIGVLVAQDQNEKISSLISDGLITKPNEIQISEWEINPQKSFQAIIIQPYVLVQIAFN